MVTLQDLIGPLRVDIDSLIPRESPYSYQGPDGPWDEEEVQLAFANATVIHVGAVDQTRSSTFFNLGNASPMSPLGTMGALGSMGAFPEILPSTGEFSTLTVTKAGLLNRKDDLLEGGKKSSNRKWKPWSVCLTGSQLLFFRDGALANGLLSSSDRHVNFDETALLKPDEVLSVKDAIAMFDRSYSKVCRFRTSLYTIRSQ